MSVRDTVHFVLNGQRQSVTVTQPTQTVLQYLRGQLRLMGTKEGCAEGDCGACTNMEASLAPDGQLRYRAVNACIRFLPTLDGKAIWTVEGLRGPGGKLHPIQQALVDHHGSQCGFCTPGFVMSLYTLYSQGHHAPSRQQVLDQLSGNLCRCTGYRPIIDAAMAMANYPAPPDESEKLVAQLTAMREQCAASLEAVSEAGSYWAPSTTVELAQRYEAHPDADLLAGGTDAGLWVTKQLRHLPKLIYIGNVTELDLIQHQDAHICIGANVRLDDAYQALISDYPEAHELWRRFASCPIRGSGTLVGNLANGSPIGDSAPLLIALGAEIILRRGHRRRRLPLEELYIDYRKQAREPGEFIESVLIPMRDRAVQVASYKLSKRIDQDISAVCSAYALRVEAGLVADIRIAHGGMAAISKRAHHAENSLRGRPWCEQSVQEAMQAMEDDYQPMTDARATAEYRLNAARNLLYRFYMESTAAAETRI